MISPITSDKSKNESTGGSSKKNLCLIMMIAILLIVVACLGSAVAYLQLTGTRNSGIEANQENGKGLLSKVEGAFEGSVP